MAKCKKYVYKTSLVTSETNIQGHNGIFNMWNPHKQQRARNVWLQNDDNSTYCKLNVYDKENSWLAIPDFGICSKIENAIDMNVIRM